MNGPDIPQPDLVIDIAIAAPAWGDEADLRPKIEHVLSKALEVGRFDLPAKVELSLLLTDDAQIRELNRIWRGKDKATNVLSFPAGELEDAGADGGDREATDAERPLLLGDIVIARETMVAEALGDGKPEFDHFCHLLVHGFVHLMGYDHEEDDEATEMEALETEILVELGVADPYAELST